MVRAVFLLVISSLAVLGLTQRAGASYTLIVGTEFAYCVVTDLCYGGEECTVEDLQIGGVPCVAECIFPECDYEAVTEGFPPWHAYGEMSSYCVGGDVCGFSAAVSVGGTRVPQPTFTGAGSYGVNDSLLCDDFCGAAEVAVFRFSGDPAELAALTPETIYDLVDAGLIGMGDILFLKDTFPAPESGWEQIAFEIDVRGVVDREIYLFSTLRIAPEAAEGAMLVAGFGALWGLSKLKLRSHIRAPRGRDQEDFRRASD